VHRTSSPKTGWSKYPTVVTTLQFTRAETRHEPSGAETELREQRIRNQMTPQRMRVK